MLIPRFTVRQDNDFIYLDIKVPYAKISEIDADVDGSEFTFWLKPYFLRLNFPCELASNGLEEAKYDVEKGTFNAKLPKKNPGEEFQNLDMIAQLMNRKEADKVGLIEMVDDEEIQEDSTGQINPNGYGFQKSFVDFFKNRQEEMYELFDYDPDKIDDREAAQMESENKDFDLDKYLYDCDIEDVPNGLEIVNQSYLITFGDLLEKQDYNEDLISISKQKVIIDSRLNNVTFCQVLDIVLAFCYNEILGIEANHHEAGVTINKISSSLSCLAESDNICSVLKSFVRRVLVYGLYRNMEIAHKAIKDTKDLFEKLTVVKILIQVYNIFLRSEPRFLLNKLFIEKLIVWIQRINFFEQFAEEFKSTELPQIEQLGIDFSF